MVFLNGLKDFINSSALYGVDILQKDISSEVDSVKLMTLHASKGLEFYHVFITGVNYGLIPLQTRDMEEEEEERRLFFVGITREKDYLELSYYTNPDFYGHPREKADLFV
jgi:DNA helicase II / ATP-dependent DNA helicase PcrA